MKQAYLFCLLFISYFSNAQIISFTDANFKAKLLTAAPGQPIAYNSLDMSIKIDTNYDNEIQVSEALLVYKLDVSYDDISNMIGIEYFTNLEELGCSNNQITNLNLQGLNNLNKLYCQDNQISSINIQGLTNLNSIGCSNNQISNLNIQGLTNLNIINCSNNLLTSLNAQGLNNLTELICNNNQITNINLQGVNNLSTLNCNFNQLSSLNLDNLVNLVSLSCANNQLTEINIDDLNNIWYINFSNNQISTFNANDKFYLAELICYNNQLTTLFLKNGENLGQMSLSENPNLQYICCDELQIAWIQWILEGAGYTNTCNVNSYCTFTDGNQLYNLQGQQKLDNENDGCDVTDSTFPNLKYSITDGTTTGSIITNNSGNYAIPLPGGQYTVTPILENPNYFTVSPANVLVNFPSQTSPQTQNFCFSPIGIKHDVEVSIIPINAARPGFDANYKIIYKNKGNQVENGTINLEFYDNVLDLVSTNPAFSSQTTNNLNWTYSNLQPFETREINVEFNINSPMETPAVNAGDFLIYSVEITQVGLDEMMSDNSFGLKQIVVNSYDPNDKTCLEGNYITPDKVGEYVHYMIRFENTGTFPAENIVVKDMIDTAKFDVSSLIPLHASHNYVTKITDNKIEFIFENINLPFDDATNDGYIAFKIKTLPSLVLGNTFSNSANIYFDYNFPIVTNTATTTIAALSNPSFEFANYFSLHPNPTTSELNISLKSAVEINSIEIYNTIRQLVTVQTGNDLKVDVSNLKTGNYFIKINTNEGFSTSQFIKE